MTVEELFYSKEYEYHHTARAKGYVSRKTSGYVEPYSGRFGHEGYIAHRPAWDSTRYHIVSYYIKKPSISRV